MSSRGHLQVAQFIFIYQFLIHKVIKLSTNVQRSSKGITSLLTLNFLDAVEEYSFPILYLRYFITISVIG